MILKFLFDRIVALIELLILWPVLLVVVILVKIKMPGGPVFFLYRREWALEASCSTVTNSVR